MRIIAGIHRSRRLLAPEGREVTRPITDRAKQSLFDRLWSAGVLEAGNALDIFSGTGSLGLEALSRGMDHCTFLERDRSALALLKQNIESLDLQQQTSVLTSDALSPGWLNLLPHKPVRVIFCDPPYKLTQDAAGMTRLSSLLEALAAVSTEDAALTFRTDHRTQPPSPQGWTEPLSQRYAGTVIHLYRRAAPQAG